jgi:hypothetical protein
MSYAGISVREAMQKLNNLDSGWYLPYIQRQYVWGERYESEEYVCLLLDSLKEGYPIGGLVLWETRKRVSYRKFLDEYEKKGRKASRGRLLGRPQVPGFRRPATASYPTFGAVPHL